MLADSDRDFCRPGDFRGKLFLGFGDWNSGRGSRPDGEESVIIDDRGDLDLVDTVEVNTFF